MKKLLVIIFLLNVYLVNAQKSKNKFVETSITSIDLFNYQIECYNDSAMQLRHYDSIDCIIEDNKCVLRDHYKVIWMHKQATFEGFIWYIYNKEKKRLGMK